MGKLLYATCLASTRHSFQCWTASDSCRSHGCFVIASSTMHRARIRASLHCHLHNTSSSIHKVGGCEPLVDGDLSSSMDVQDKTLADYIVIGSGIGGLSCGAILARYGADVLVLESHSVPGGAAQSFEVQGYQFSGPSLFSSLSSRGPQANPLAQVLDALDEKVDCATYDSLMMYLPEGDLLSRIGPTDFFEVLRKYGGPNAVAEWQALQDTVIPLSKVATALPPAAIRGDIGVVITALARYAPSLVRSFIAMGPKGALGASKLLCPFSTILDSLGIKDRFLRNWLDLLSFLLSGLKAEGTLAAEVVYMFAEWYKPGSVLEYPLGGTGAIVDALIRGLRKRKGKLALNSHVKEIILEGRRAVGVRLRSGQVVVAKKAIVSNASLWDTLSLLPKGAVPNDLEQRQRTTSPCNSFMHLHLGIDAKHRSQFQEGDPIPALVVGLSAPQGCGKTTLVDALEYLFNSPSMLIGLIIPTLLD